MRLRRRSFIALAAAAGLARPARAEETLFFSAIPDEDETRLIARFNRVAAYLAGKLGTAVRYVPVKTYAASITAFRNNQIQLAWFGGLSGVQARRAVPGSQALAQGEEDTHFVSYFIAHASTGLAESAELPAALEGKSFTFGERGSTSGRLMPEFYLRRRFADRSPEQIFRRVGFSGDHSRTAELVASNAYEVGALNFAVYDQYVRENRIDPAVARIIWRTPPFPDYHWTARGDVDARFGAGFTDRLRQALLDMSDPELLASFPRRRFVPASNADYQAILDTAQAIGLMDS